WIKFRSASVILRCLDHILGFRERRQMLGRLSRLCLALCRSFGLRLEHLCKQPLSLRRFAVLEALQRALTGIVASADERTARVLNPSQRPLLFLFRQGFAD